MRKSLALILSIGMVMLSVPVASPQTEYRARVIAERVNVRSEPSVESVIVTTAAKGAMLRVTGQKGDWLHVVVEGTAFEGNVYKSYVEAVDAQAAGETPERRDVRPVSSDPPEIEHRPLKCVKAQEHPLVKAGVTSEIELQRNRVYFKAHQYPDWYYVDMQSTEVPDFMALLPQPLPGTKKVDYYVQSLDVSKQTSRTDQYEPNVTKYKCRRDAVPPPDFKETIIVGGTQAGQAAIPPGFSAAGIVGFVTVAGVVITGAALTGGGAATTASGAAAATSGGATGASSGGGAAAGAAAAGGTSLVTVGLGIAAIVAGGVVATNKITEKKDDNGESKSGNTGAPKTLTGTWSVHIRCVGETTDVVSITITLNQTSGGSFTGTAVGTDYDGSSLTITLSGSYDSSTGRITGQSRTDNGRIDSFSTTLSSTDSGYVAMSCLQYCSCNGEIRMYRLN